MGVAGVHPPVYRNVRVYREVRLPRLMPRKQRMNLRLEHEQQAKVEATFHPVLEDDSFGARDRCRCAARQPGPGCCFGGLVRLAGCALDWELWACSF